MFNPVNLWAKCRMTRTSASASASESKVKVKMIIGDGGQEARMTLYHTVHKCIVLGIICT